MKTMTCKQLGGACDLAFRAETFDAIAQQSRQHGMDMHAAGDAAHLEAMRKMKTMMQDPNAMQAWMEDKRAAFDALPED